MFKNTFGSGFLDSMLDIGKKGKTSSTILSDRGPDFSTLNNVDIFSSASLLSGLALSSYQESLAKKYNLVELCKANPHASPQEIANLIVGIDDDLKELLLEILKAIVKYIFKKVNKEDEGTSELARLGNESSEFTISEDCSKVSLGLTSGARVWEKVTVVVEK